MMVYATTVLLPQISNNWKINNYQIPWKERKPEKKKRLNKRNKTSEKFKR